MSNELKSLLNYWSDSGRVLWHYPRNKMISLSGCKPITYTEALHKLKEFKFNLESIKGVKS